MSIILTSHGAAGTVTGSKHLLEVTDREGNVRRILLDCGMFQGEALEGSGGKDRNRRFGFDPASIDMLILSHAHIDHSGLIPRLVRDGFSGPIYCTPATRDLCNIMLEDSARIQEYDAAYDKKRSRKHRQEQKHEEPLYTSVDVPPAMELFQAVDYGEDLVIGPGLQLVFTDTGHILGSAAVSLRIDDGDQELRLTFTGDVGRYVDRLLPAPQPFPTADVVLCESTYGDRDHQPIAEAEEELLRHVTRICVEQKGRLIIPAFSIGKTQEILYTLNSLSNSGRLPRIPVFVDSPLAISATDIVRRHDRLFREEVREELREDPDLFDFPGIEFVRAPERSRQLNSLTVPCIVISASGMMEAGRIRHHLFHGLSKPENGLLIVGFCAPGTLGAELLEGATDVRIFGEYVPVKASIMRMEFYSAHADRGELVRYLHCQDMKAPPRIFLVHGVDKVRERFKQLLGENGFTDVVIPGQRKAYVL